MFKLSLVTLILVSVAAATPFVKRKTLAIEVAAPASLIESIDSLVITASVTNTGSETLKVLKYATIFDDSIPTRSFIVTKNGAEVAFTGIRLNVDLESVGDIDYVELAAGETRTFTHDVKSLYDFESAGTGVFKFEPVGFTTKDIEVTGNTIEFEVTKDVAKRDHTLNKRARNICEGTTAEAIDHKSQIIASYGEARELAALASVYIWSRGANFVYSAYFGFNFVGIIRAKYDAIVTEFNSNSSTPTLSCIDSYNVCGGGVIAYTLIATRNIYYCPLFFDEVGNSPLCQGTTVASRHVRGGTTLHELTHSFLNTVDVTYGCAADQTLSDANKLVNADNYNCFATQVYYELCDLPPIEGPF